MSEFPIDRRRVLKTTGAGLVGSGLLAANVGAQSDDRIRWTFETGDRVESSPTVVDGTVYVGSENGSLYAVDAAAGEQQWAFESGSGIFSSPTVVDGTVYVGAKDGSLYGVEATAGEQRWAFETDSAIYSSPTVIAGTVYVGSTDGSLYAVASATGEQRWTFETVGSVYSSPVAVDGTIYVGGGNILYALDASTGVVQWHFDVESTIYGAPTVADGTVYVGGDGGPLYAVDAATGEHQWTAETVDGMFRTPTVVDGTVYVGSVDLHAVDAATGEQRWTVETDGSINSSPTVADGTVAVGTHTSLSAVDAVTGEQRWTVEIDDGIYSSPTVVDGTIYVGTQGNGLYAVEADIDGSSVGSRVRQQVLGHHDRDPVLERAVVDYAPTLPETDEAITFDGAAVRGPAEAYTWEFGDGTTATGETVTHSYDEAGEYDVTLTVQGSDGDEVSTTATIPVGQPTGTLSVSVTPSDATVAVGTEDAIAAITPGWRSGIFTVPTLPSGATVLLDEGVLEAREIERPAGRYEVLAIHPEQVGHTGYKVATETVTVDAGETTTVELDLTGGSGLQVGDYEPQDTTDDGLYNDFDGDGDTTHDDVSIFFEHLEADAIRDNPDKFDFDGNDRLGFADVIDLLRRV